VRTFLSGKGTFFITETLFHVRVRTFLSERDFFHHRDFISCQGENIFCQESFLLSQRLILHRLAGSGKTFPPFSAYIQLEARAFAVKDKKVPKYQIKNYKNLLKR